MRVKTVFDFRDLDELGENNTRHKLNADYFNCAINLESAKIMNLKNNKTLMNALKRIHKEDMQIAYRKMPFNNRSYCRLINLIRGGMVPVIFHCNVGKDRTGIAAALILLMLGANEEEIIKDYLKTQNIEKFIAKSISKDINFLLRGVITRCIKPVFLADESYIRASLDEIKKRYISAEKFFEAEYQITPDEIKRLREKYTD